MSTLRQLGMMLFILSVGLWLLSFIHIVIHAFFKSMLFLRTGSLMSNLGGSQESRFYGSGLRGYISFTYFMVSSFCLAGFPFFIGFYSKDFIIRQGFLGNGLFYFYFFILGCLFTVGYRFRLINMAYFFIFKTFNYLIFVEKSLFFNSVLLLFFKGWLLGGLFYWFFLVDATFFFFMFDLLIGLIILLAGVVLYLFLKWGYWFIFSFGSIYFMRWVGRINFRSYFKSMFFYKNDGGWLEIMGGGGVYKTLRILSKYMGIFESFGMGFVISITFFSSFYFFLTFLVVSTLALKELKNSKYSLFLNLERVKFCF